MTYRLRLRGPAVNTPTVAAPGGGTCCHRVP